MLDLLNWSTSNEVNLSGTGDDAIAAAGELGTTVAERKLREGMDEFDSDCEREDDGVSDSQVEAQLYK